MSASDGHPQRHPGAAAAPEQATDKFAHLKWRVVACEAGDAPRGALKVWRCIDYHEARSFTRSLLKIEQLWYPRFTALVSHSRDEPAWIRAEAIRVAMYCPIATSRILQIEYQEGADDCPADLFTVPRPAGCWRCGSQLGPKDRAYCSPCKVYRRRAFNAWLMGVERRKERTVQT